MSDVDFIKRDHRWIEQIQTGDHTTFTDLFQTYHARLCGFALRYVKSREVAKDLVQEVFLNIWKQRTQWNPPGTVRSYLYKAVRNRAINHYEHQQVKEKYAAEVVRRLYPSPQAMPVEELSYGELKANIQRAVEQLPERRRLIFTLSRVDGLTYKEIAETLDISVNTVQTQMKRALSYLREQLSVYQSEAP